MTRSQSAPASSFSFIRPTAPNVPSIANPVSRTKPFASAATRPCAAPALSTFNAIVDRSVDFRARHLDHLRPLLDVLAQIGVELRRRHDHRLRPLLGPLLLHFGRREDLVDLGV